MTQPIVLYAGFDKGTDPVTGLTVTVNVYRITRSSGAASQIVTAGSATALGDGVYLYAIGAADLQTYDYLAAFKTTGDVDKKTVWAVYPALANAYATELARLDAAISTRNAVAPLDSTATQAAAAAALTAYDAATGADVAAVTAPSAADNADAVWDELLAGHAGAGSAGAALSAAGGAADPLLNDVPGSYGTGTGGYALGRLLAISNAALYSPATRNNQFLLAAAIQGALRPVQQVTWLDGEGVALDLTDATITGIIRNRASGATRAIAGDLDITQATDGIFTWSYDAADVVDAGQFDVQFTATWDAPALSPARTFTATWAVHEALVVPD